MIRALPLIAGVLPVLGVCLAYWLGVYTGVLPACVPFFEGCTSISATGRYMPGSIPFRGALLPQSAILVVLWWFAVQWLRQVTPTARSGKAILVCGVIGAVALIVYVLFLGTSKPIYEFMRRFGIYFYFLGTALSQIMLSVAVPHSRLRSLMILVIVIPFGLGIANLIEKSVFQKLANFENSIEWIAAFLMQTWFVLLYFVWRDSDFRVDSRTGPTSARR